VGLGGREAERVADGLLGLGAEGAGGDGEKEGSTSHETTMLIEPLNKTSTIHVIGGGLAGCEAAWRLARAGLRSTLWEMRPQRTSEAHQTDRLAELVCSNSLKSDSENTASWLLKQELRRLGSLSMEVAEKARVPGGHALPWTREVFAGR